MNVMFTERIYNLIQFITVVSRPNLMTNANICTLNIGRRGA